MNFDQEKLEVYIKNHISQLTDEVPMQISYYSSFFEDLGSERSDVDVYVIFAHDNPVRELFTPGNSCVVEMHKKFDIPLDIEYYTLADVQKIIHGVLKYDESSFYDVNIMNIKPNKFVNKYINSVKLCHVENDFDMNINTNLAKITKNNMVMVRNYFFRLYREEREDAVKFFYDEAYISTFILQQQAMQYLLLAFFALIGRPVFKEKWLYQKFLSIVEDEKYKFLKNYFSSYYFLSYNQINKDIVQKNFEVLQKLTITLQNYQSQKIV